ncbi:DUF2087 domain-containing protein [Glycomyces terrestris]|uniref:DUF2087 domain-containing protein n=1 Tax=Glycomyces terrestris TaxID=2493553 RepID=A0A426UTL0_9ACTN|nr:DUF2087 domain-containing protein [Glycomyces terrestris]RRR96962.1 DUF2087 domain-containing protein [Glycomyces terrestris]
MEPSHEIVKALADPDRLRVFAAIVLAGDTGTGLAALRQTHPRADQALPRLVRAGLVTTADTGFRADPQAFRDAAAAARSAVPDAPAGTAPDVAHLYRAGRLTVIPTRRATRVAVLRDLADRLFEHDRVYTQDEVTAALADVHDDPLTLRREMIDELLLERTLGGREYRRREAPPI